MKILIDQEKCLGCGSCTAICPDLFELGDDNKAHSKESKSEDKKDNINCLQEAIDICPVEAIKIEK